MQSELLAIPEFIFYLFSLLILALIYNSFTLYFATYDREQRDAFFEGGILTITSVLDCLNAASAPYYYRVP